MFVIFSKLGANMMFPIRKNTENFSMEDCASILPYLLKFFQVISNFSHVRLLIIFNAMQNL